MRPLGLHILSMAWYKMKKGELVYQENTSESEIFHGIPLESVA